MMNVFKTLTNGILEKAKTYRGDWNVNDSSSPNYIENRPFYEEDPVEKVLVNNHTNNYYPFNEDAFPFFDIVLGNTYKITWDGKEYTCTAKEIEPGSGFNVIGNIGMIGSGVNTGEPFLIGLDGSEIVCIAQTEGSHNIKIIGVISEVHKIDEKFLPDLSQYVKTEDINDFLVTMTDSEVDTICDGTFYNASEVTF